MQKYMDITHKNIQKAVEYANIRRIYTNDTRIEMNNIHKSVNKNEICAYRNGQMCAGCGKYSWKM
jgi:hypothetical protein